jgi:hypothetical protein
MEILPKRYEVAKVFPLVVLVVFLLFALCSPVGLTSKRNERRRQAKSAKKNNLMIKQNKKKK